MLLQKRFGWSLQCRQKTPLFETLPSEKTIKLGLGRVRLVTSFQEFFCGRCDQQLAQRKCLMTVLFSGVTTLQIGGKVLDFIRYIFMEQKNGRKKKNKKNVGWLCSTEAHIESQPNTQFCVRALPRGPLHREVFRSNWTPIFNEDCEKMKLEFASTWAVQFVGERERKYLFWPKKTQAL